MEIICKKHGLTDHRPRSDRDGWLCKKCNSESATKAKQNRKKKCVEYKGGKCERCGYSKCVNALEFHHKNPNEKDFNISTFGYRMSFEELKSELDKCILLCANCHREVHADGG